MLADSILLLLELLSYVALITQTVRFCQTLEYLGA
jgi:hypothetical protein